MATTCSTYFINKRLLESQALECVWTLIPGIILIQIALPSLTLLYLLEECPRADLTVKASGNQWFWEYEYSDFWFSSKEKIEFSSYILNEAELKNGIFRQLEVDNRLILPHQHFIRILVTRGDVLHSWTVPALGVKTDAVPGRLNQVNFFSELTGILYGQCSEICGAEHSSMPIVVELIPLKSFIRWISAAALV